MAAYVLRRLSESTDVKSKNYGEYLERHPPQWEVEIHEKSPLERAHGVGRWLPIAAARWRGDRQQKWRAAPQGV